MVVMKGFDDISSLLRHARYLVSAPCFQSYAFAVRRRFTTSLQHIKCMSFNMWHRQLGEWCCQLNVKCYKTLPKLHRRLVLFLQFTKDESSHLLINMSVSCIEMRCERAALGVEIRPTFGSGFIDVRPTDDPMLPDGPIHFIFIFLCEVVTRSCLCRLSF